MHIDARYFFLESPQHLGIELSNVPWDEVIQDTSHELLLPALLYRVRSLGLTASIPAEVLECLDTAETQNAQRNEVFIEEALYATKLLNSIGIQPVALKGVAYLFAGVYPDLGSRYLSDVDLLIPAADLDRAAAHFLANGYLEDKADLFGRFRHHFPAIRRPDRPPIELHDCVGIGICERVLPASDLIRSATHVCHGGAHYLIPSPSHLVNHLILHSQLAHPYGERIRPPLRAVVDLAQLQRRFGNEIDWRSISNCYREVGQTDTYSLHFLQAAQDIDLKIKGVNAELYPLSSRGLGSFLRLRWWRRRILNRYKWIRLIDPIYIVMSLFSRRLRILRNVLSQPRSWYLLLQRLTSLEFYRNILADFR